MTQEDKQLLLKDLCARLPYKLKVQYKENTYDLLGLDKGRIFANIARIGEWLPGVYTFDIKPYLRPMSSMTEEEEKEICQFMKDYNLLPGSNRAGVFCGEIVDWLNSNYFDYRGLIEKGLALPAPEGMYK